MKYILILSSSLHLLFIFSGNALALDTLNEIGSSESTDFVEDTYSFQPPYDRGSPQGGNPSTATR